MVKWVNQSNKAGKPWVVAFDEPGNAKFGTPSDPNYPGTPKNFSDPSVDQVRRQALWGTLLAGGAGVEYYFGYQLPQNDLNCEDWRSRELTWNYSRVALDFFRENRIPFWEMQNHDPLVGNSDHRGENYCFAKRGSLYLVYLAKGGKIGLDLRDVSGEFSLSWFNPRKGGDLEESCLLNGADRVTLEAPSKGDDWLAMIQKTR